MARCPSRNGCLRYPFNIPYKLDMYLCSQKIIIKTREWNRGETNPWLIFY